MGVIKMKFLVLAIFGQSLATTNSTADCIEAENALTQATHSNVYGLKLSCEVACAGVDGATCADKSDECIIAENALANEQDALAKMPLKLACEGACAGVVGAACGFLVNGVSMILFALLAMFK